MQLNRLLCGATLAFFIGCAPSLRITPGQLPPAQLPDASLKSEAEYYVNQHIDEGNYREIKSGPDLKRIKTLVSRLAVAAGYPANTFPVHLVDAGPEVNAAAFDGASIVVYLELMRKITSDDELAVVLGHEMGHILAKHYSEAKEQEGRAQAVSVGSSILGAVASVATSVAGYGGASDLAGSVTEGATGVIGYGAFVGSFSRRQEYEADHLGLLIMAKAGYDPRKSIEFWKRSEAVFGAKSSQAGAFFNTHPAESDRQKALEEAMPYAMKLYDGAPHVAPDSDKPDAGAKKGKARKKS